MEVNIMVPILLYCMSSERQPLLYLYVCALLTECALHKVTTHL